MADWLEEIEARANAATKGPWGVDATGDQDAPFDVHAVDEMGTGANMLFDALLPADEESPADRAHANALFACYARTDVPRLVAEVRKLRAALEPMLDEPFISDYGMPLIRRTCRLCGVTRESTRIYEQSAPNSFIHARDCPVLAQDELLGKA